MSPSGIVITVYKVWRDLQPTIGLFSLTLSQVLGSIKIVVWLPLRPPNYVKNVIFSSVSGTTCVNGTLMMVEGRSIIL
jgi:hypothetical protein